MENAKRHNISIESAILFYYLLWFNGANIISLTLWHFFKISFNFVSATYNFFPPFPKFHQVWSWKQTWATNIIYTWLIFCHNQRYFPLQILHSGSIFFRCEWDIIDLFPCSRTHTYTTTSTFSKYVHASFSVYSVSHILPRDIRSYLLQPIRSI